MSKNRHEAAPLNQQKDPISPPNGNLGRRKS